MKRRRMDNDRVEPDDMIIIIGELSVGAIVCPRVMGRQMSMSGRPRVIRIGFVDVRRRERR